MDKYRAAGDFERTEICRDAFTKYCHRPEISGKIANYIVYQELSPEANARIVIKFIRQELANYDIKLRSIDRHCSTSSLTSIRLTVPAPAPGTSGHRWAGSCCTCN